jgi:CheY-like chemotaxis protein
MTTETNKTAAILIAPQGTGGQLRGLVERLMNVGVQVTIVDEIAAAVDLYHELADPPALLVDLRDVGSEEMEDSRLATELLKRIKMPVLAMSTPAVLLACMRGGAADVIDLKLEGTANAKTVVERVCSQQRDHATRHDLIEKQRVMIEDLLKDLIKTERRSLDVEEQLAGYARISGTHPVTEQRGPSVLLVEHDRAVADELADKLEAAGVATFAYVTGEEAVREAKTLAKSATGLDLVLVAAQLPGIDGLETIRRLRDRIAHLPAFLMTSVLDAELAASAADLGVVGFVTKPLADLDEVVARLSQLAKESLERAREQQYVQRIKERHERVLERYRSLPREP